jgi:N-acetyl-alpha-D-muramate 1-phosphate uridylyltransferase
MEAMILAAGGGTRLRPLTDHVPKALVQVGGRPLLAWVMGRLAEAGATRIIVNTHHHQHQIRSFLETHAPGGVELVLSPEPEGPYDTGGGLFRAAHLFLESTPFLLHNVDVLSSVHLRALLAEHARAGSLREGRVVASLAVQDREARRRLLFDDVGLMGWENRGSDRAPVGRQEVREAVGPVRSRSFTGIHAVEPAIFRLGRRTGSFSIVDLYLELAGQGWIIHPVDVSEEEWIDMGTPERLQEARARYGE